jgi:hypothetical protein
VREQRQTGWAIEFEDGLYVFGKLELSRYMMSPRIYNDNEVRQLVLCKICDVLFFRFCLLRSNNPSVPDKLRLLRWHLNSCFVDTPGACELAVAAVTKAPLPPTSCLPFFYVYLLGVMDACYLVHLLVSTLDT